MLRNLTTAAVFLSEPPKGGFFAGYPLFKLGDFGHAFATDMVDYKNTNDFAQANRPERQAPVVLKTQRCCVGSTILIHALGVGNRGAILDRND